MFHAKPLKIIVDKKWNIYLLQLYINIKNVFKSNYINKNLINLKNKFLKRIEFCKKLIN
jgi:hypothetical protein